MPYCRSELRILHHNSRSIDQQNLIPVMTQIREPKRGEGVTYTPGAEDRIIQQLRLLGWQVHDYEIDVRGLSRWYFVAARYVEDFPHYYPTNLAEKSARTLLQRICFGSMPRISILTLPVSIVLCLKSIVISSRRQLIAKTLPIPWDCMTTR